MNTCTVLHVRYYYSGGVRMEQHCSTLAAVGFSTNMRRRGSALDEAYEVYTNKAKACTVAYAYSSQVNAAQLCCSLG